MAGVASVGQFADCLRKPPAIFGLDRVGYRLNGFCHRRDVGYRNALIQHRRFDHVPGDEIEFIPLPE